MWHRQREQRNGNTTTKNGSGTRATHLKEFLFVSCIRAILPHFFVCWNNDYINYLIFFCSCCPCATFLLIFCIYLCLCVCFRCVFLQLTCVDVYTTHTHLFTETKHPWAVAMYRVCTMQRQTHTNTHITRYEHLLSLTHLLAESESPREIAQRNKVSIYYNLTNINVWRVIKFISTCSFIRTGF